MSNLPCEILDHIVDLLHDHKITLKRCCPVSKSWVPRTRRYLFAEVEFRVAKNLETWKRMFPDPSTSPAHYTKALFIGGPKVITAVDVEADSWVRGFSRVSGRGWEAAFDQVGGFLPSVKSLLVKSVTFSPSRLSNLILSFPLLEDLSVTNCHGTSSYDASYLDGLATAIQSAGLPVFTGSLKLSIMGGIGHIVHGWVSHPGGIHFRKLALEWNCEEDISLTIALVEKCSHTLESLDITCSHLYGTSVRHLRLHRSNLLIPLDPRSASFDLSKATKLVDVIFRLESLRVEWISLALRAVTTKHRDLQRISVDLPYHFTWLSVGDFKRAIGEEAPEEWLDLDHILVHLWESLSIRTNVAWRRGLWKEGLEDYVGFLSPEMAKRGMVTFNYA